MKLGTKINSNMLNLMVMFIFYVFNWKYPFWANLGKSFVEDETWHQDWLEYDEFDGYVWYISFGKQIFILVNFGSKSQNCAIKMKLRYLS